MKKFLYVMRRPPYSGLHLAETLDMLLTTAAFDQPVTLLFLDDGAYQLHGNQQAQALGLKNTAATYQALEIYEVEQVYVETESLNSRLLNIDTLILPVQCLPRQQVAEFMHGFDVIIHD